MSFLGRHCQCPGLHLSSLKYAKQDTVEPQSCWHVLFPPPWGSAEVPVWGPTCPFSLLPARTVRAGPVPGRFLGLGSGRPGPGGRRMEWRAEAVPGQPPWAPAILMCLLSGPGGEAGCSLLGPGRSGCRGPAAGAGSLSPSLCLLPSTTRQVDRHLAGRGNPGRRLG